MGGPREQGRRSPNWWDPGPGCDGTGMVVAVRRGSSRDHRGEEGRADRAEHGSSADTGDRPRRDDEPPGPRRADAVSAWPAPSAAPITAPRPAAPTTMSTSGGWSPVRSVDSADGADAAAQPSPATTSVTTSQRRRPRGPMTSRSTHACSPPSAAPSTSPPSTTSSSPHHLAWDPPRSARAVAARAAPAAALMPRPSATEQAMIHERFMLVAWRRGRPARQGRRSCGWPCAPRRRPRHAEAATDWGCRSPLVRWC
jgi:hypothetical protein